MTTTRWLIRRLVPYVLLVIAGGIVAGFVRKAGVFLPGISGMAAGGVLGWLTGRLARKDPEETKGFGLRGGLTLGAGVLHETVAAVTVSVLSAKPGDGPLRWLGSVLSGYGGEPFYGISRYSLQSVSGRLQGGSWLFFVLVDFLLFAFLFLVSNGAGSSPDEEDEREGTVSQDAGEAPEPPPLPETPATASGPRGILVFGIFAAVTVASLIVPQRMWSARTGPDIGPRSHAVAARLAGPWVFGPEASFLGSREADRTFTISYGPGGRLAGLASGSGKFLFTLEPRLDGSYHGSLVLGEDTAFSLSMRPSGPKDELRFAFFRYMGSGPRIYTVSARRPAGGTVSSQGRVTPE